MATPSSKAKATLGKTFRPIILVGSVTLLTLTGAVAISTASRYAFGRPIGAVFELSGIALMIMTFPLLAWLTSEDRHVRVDIFLNASASKARAAVDGLGNVVTVFVSAIVAYGAVDLMFESIGRGTKMLTVLALPEWPLFAIVAFGMVLLGIERGSRAWRLFRGRGTDSPSD